MKVSVIGLGVMGEPIARNLFKAGFALTVFNRSRRKSDPFREIAFVATSAQAAISASDVTILMVPSDREINEILAVAANGRVCAPLADKIIVNMATVAPEYSEQLAQAIAAAGGRYVEAPVAGSRQPAEMAALVVLAAGDGADLDHLQPLFAAIGKATLRCGAPPNAMRMKLANNLLLIALMEAFVEAFNFARGLGLDTEQFINLVLNGQMANDLFRAKAPKLLGDDFTPQAPLKHVAKDIKLICGEAQRVGINTPVARTNKTLFAQAVEKGLSEDDVMSIIKILEGL
jgi:3-hydroxyisobutyrate dehydrogenase